MAAKTTDYLGQYNKFMGEFNKYSPYLNMFKGGNIAKNAAETALDAGVSSIPVYGQAYQGVKMFNQMTGGGINFNKMLGVKNPLTQLSSSLFGRKKTAEEEQAADPEYAKYMGMLSDMQNSSAAAERSALEKRQAIQPMQEKAVNDYMDILQNGLSSRQLAPVYAAGEARNRAIGAGAEAGLMSQVANRGMSGGIQAGLEAAVQGNRNALSADLNSRITQQQIAARPAMLGQAANLTMSMENQAQQELAQAAMNRMNASQIGLSAYNANQQNERYKEQLEDARKTARNTEMGALIGKFGPDIAKGIKGLLNKGKSGTPDYSNPNSTEILGPEFMAEPPLSEFSDVSQIPQTVNNGSSLQTGNAYPFRTMGPNEVAPNVSGVNEMPVEESTRIRLDMQFDPNGKLPVGTRRELNGVSFFKTTNGWTKSYDRMPFVYPGGIGTLKSMQGQMGDNFPLGPGSSLTQPPVYQDFWK